MLFQTLHTNQQHNIMVSMDTSEDVVEQQQQQEEGVVHTEHNTTLFYGQRDKGKGTLYITEHHVVWKGCHDNNHGNHDTTNVLTLQYPSISLHAISRDTSSFPHQCLYVLLESPLTERDEAAAAEDEDVEAEAEEREELMCCRALV